MSTPPDVTLLLHSLAGGGAEWMTIHLAREFSRRGLKVEILVARAEGPLLREARAVAEVVECGVDTSMAWRHAIEGYLRERRPGAVISGMEAPSVVTLWARRRAGLDVPVVAVSHNHFSRHTRAATGWKERWLLPWMVRWLYPSADGIVAVSRGVADDLVRTGWLDPDSVEVIHNPVVTDRTPDRAAQPVSHPWLGEESPHGKVVVAAGRLTAQKDVPTLLRALARLEREPPVRLIVLGEGEERPALEALAAELGLADRVSMPGFVDNPLAYMARADLFALSSAWEGFGNVLVEAMACGCPVVSTDCPSGPSEILEGGRWGRLVPVGDPAALARAMSDTLNDPPPAEDLRARARTFHVERIADRYLALLARVGWQAPDRREDR